MRSGKKEGEKYRNNGIWEVENINTCLTFLANLGVSVEGLSAKANLGVSVEGLSAKGGYDYVVYIPGQSWYIKDGNLKAILGLFFSLSRYKQQQKTQQKQEHNKCHLGETTHQSRQFYIKNQLSSSDSQSSLDCSTHAGISRCILHYACWIATGHSIYVYCTTPVGSPQVVLPCWIATGHSFSLCILYYTCWIATGHSIYVYCTTPAGSPQVILSIYVYCTTPAGSPQVILFMYIVLRLLDRHRGIILPQFNNTSDRLIPVEEQMVFKVVFLLRWDRPGAIRFIPGAAPGIRFIPVEEQTGSFLGIAPGTRFIPGGRPRKQVHSCRGTTGSFLGSPQEIGSFLSRNNRSFLSRNNRSFLSRNNRSFLSRNNRSFLSRNNRSFLSRINRSFLSRNIGHSWGSPQEIGSFLPRNK
ncbi:NAV3 [Mytilus edulis]|uniref:NAV3 n=1 Tax=Mytilus edulis TaxID=6550 RepID=A0A8S3RVB1_MYTED|nr:NAV3 [Mytilus edulis]